jgi:hypothetical protein
VGLLLRGNREFSGGKSHETPGEQADCQKTRTAMKRAIAHIKTMLGESKAEDTLRFY